MPLAVATPDVTTLRGYYPPPSGVPDRPAGRSSTTVTTRAAAVRPRHEPARRRPESTTGRA